MATTAAAHPSAGRVGRRRALPTGRAVAGGFLIAAAAVIVFASWSAATRPAGRQLVVARTVLAAGAHLQAGDLTTSRMQVPSGVGAASFATPGDLQGRMLAARLAPGQLVESSDLVPAGTTPRRRPVTVAVAASDLADLQVGGLVDVLVTNGTDASATTQVVVTDATLLQASSGSSSLIGGTAGAQATLGVSGLDQVEAVVHAAHTGTVTVVAGQPSDRPSADQASGAATSPVAGSGPGGSSG